MLATSTRPPTELELDLYSDMMDGRISLIASLIVSVALGGLVAAGAFGIHWVYARMTSGTATWTIPLIIGGVVAVIGFFALRSGGERRLDGQPAEARHRGGRDRGRRLARR